MENQPLQPAVLSEIVPEKAPLMAPQVNYTQYQISLQSKWDLPTTKATLEEHEYGTFHRSAQLAEYARRVDRIYAALRTRCMGALGLPFSLEAPEAKCPEHVMKAAKLAMDGIPETTLTKILRNVVMLGFCLVQIRWDYVDGYFQPVMEPWDAQWVHYDHNAKCYRVQVREGHILHVKQGDPKWALFVGGCEDDAWLDGALRPLALAILLAQVAWVDWANYNETHGQPIKLAKIPAGAKGEADPDQAATNKRFLTQLQNLKKSGLVSLPQHKEGIKELSYALELLEAKDNSWETFERFQTAINIAIALILLGQHLTSETGDIGTQALGKIHEGVRQDLMESDTDMLSSNLKAQVFRHWAVFNFGRADWAPTPKWDATPPPDQQAEVAVVKTIVDAAVAAGQAVPAIDFGALLKRYNVPMLPVGAPGAAPTPTPPAATVQIPAA